MRRGGWCGARRCTGRRWGEGCVGRRGRKTKAEIAEERKGHGDGGAGFVGVWCVLGITQDPTLAKSAWGTLGARVGNVGVGAGDLWGVMRITADCGGGRRIEGEMGKIGRAIGPPQEGHL